MSFRMSLVVCAVCIVGFTVGWFIKPTPSLDREWELIAKKIESKGIYFASAVERMVRKNMEKDIITGFKVGMNYCVEEFKTSPPDTVVIITNRTLPHGHTIVDTIMIILNQ